MPRMPTLKEGSTRREITDVFSGYFHRPRIQNGQMYDMTNLSGDEYPLLSTRKPRGVQATLTKPGGLIAKDALCYVANGTLYVNGLATAVTGLSEGDKQLVGMGAYIVVFPDKAYYNTKNAADYGSLEAEWNTTGTVTYAPCNIDGEVYTISYVSDTEPQNPSNGQIWIDTSEGSVFYQWSGSSNLWVTIPTVYTKIGFTTEGQIPASFSVYDGVEISGAYFDELNGSKVICALGGAVGAADWIVVIGLVTGAYTETTGSLRITRKLPPLDYVCECQNRLWGCYYGFQNGESVNEVYCSALGDFKNWRQYQGLSTDSWAASVGSDGPWTGAVNYLGHPVFFKEDRIHMVTVSSSGAHQMDETVCRGVQKGSWKSLQVVGETLYYKSRSDVCAWQGGFPTGVSEALGDALYSGAAAGTIRGKYYISMKDGENRWNLFVLDTARGIWHREDNLQATSFARVDDVLWAIDGENRLLALTGNAGTAEGPVSWSAESGVLSWEYPDHKYLSRYDIRLWMDQGATAKLWMEYDSSGHWEDSGTIRRVGLGTVVAPVRPRRCDHLRMKLSGTGAVRIFSIARTLEVGSDA